LKIKKNLDRWFAGRKQKGPAADHVSPATAAPAPPAAAETLEPEIVAAIAAVIAIEVKMFMAIQGQRFTFNAGGQPQGWSEWGRLLIRPYQGVR
jgi:hypothetical protein